MGSNPVNLTIRFLLELAALSVMGIWGWRHGEGWMQYLLVIGIPLFGAAVWGTFAVPNDPSRSGKAPVPVPGIIRLIIELGIFGFGIWLLFNLDYKSLGITFGIIVVIHYLVSYDRVYWLIFEKKNKP